jgi:protein SCO1
VNNVRVLRLLLPALVALSVALAACHRKPKPHERYYQLRGTVVSVVDRAHKQIIVKHEAIPGFMAAMTMPYMVKDDAALNQLEAGDRISARVVVTSDGDMWLDNIVIHKKGEPPQPQPGAEHPVPPTGQKGP